MSVPNNNSLKHDDYRDCVPHLQFVRTRGKGWGSKSRMYAGDLGNCAPAALSYACDLDYDEVRHRLVMIGNGLVECADLRSELSKIGEFDPDTGTPLYVWMTFLHLHGFELQNQFPCICDCSEPIVLAGSTGSCKTHLATVVNGEALGDYDITQKPFEDAEAWKRANQGTPHGVEDVNAIFANPSSLTARLREIVAQDELEPEKGWCTGCKE